MKAYQLFETEFHYKYSGTNFVIGASFDARTLGKPIPFSFGLVIRSPFNLKEEKGDDFANKAHFETS